MLSNSTSSQIVRKRNNKIIIYLLIVFLCAIAVLLGMKLQKEDSVVKTAEQNSLQEKSPPIDMVTNDFSTRRDLTAPTDVYYLTSRQHDQLLPVVMNDYGTGTPASSLQLADGKWEVTSDIQNTEVLKKGAFRCAITFLSCGNIFAPEQIKEEKAYCHSTYKQNNVSLMRNSGDRGQCCIALTSEAAYYLSCIDLSVETGQNYASNAALTQRFVNDSKIITIPSLFEKNMTESYSFYQ